ncbi:unnamed protein product [Microthlaspi erraticum]|uniref:Uncharacterized protein n=1 Tax=Microthlaspi erraticum TaxID=1685480 RepID=A0A6D2K0K1_9BRAS|nr:unnamed protein product [Microthlaspi erraticum]
MDFIKTSSLRALIELTFQRNWNGFIWMSRKGVIAKRVKAAPDGHIENQRRTRRPAGRGTNVPRSAKTVRPTEVSAKVPSHRPITHHDPGNIVPRSAKQRHATPRTTKRASRETSLAAAQLVPRTTADASVRAGKNVPRPAEKPSAKFIRPTKPADRETSGPTVPTRPKTRLSGRPSRRPSERRGRPEAVFEAQSAQFKPKAGADLARLVCNLVLVFDTRLLLLTCALAESGIGKGRPDPGITRVSLVGDGKRVGSRLLDHGRVKNRCESPVRVTVCFPGADITVRGDPCMIEADTT